MEELNFDTAKKIFDSGHPVLFVNEHDLEIMSVDRASIRVVKGDIEFADEVSTWYMFEPWTETKKPKLKFYSDVE